LTLVGCASGTPAITPTEAATPHILTKEEVQQIVFNHAKVTAADVLELEVDLDEEDGAIFYDVEFDDKNNEYDYRVDALSGKILYDKAEPKETVPTETQPTETQPPETQPADTKPAEEKPAETKPAETKPATTTKKKIGVTKAKNAAFKHANVKASDAWDVEVDLDTENGKLVYEVSFNAGGYDYDYDIDAYSGKVLRYEKELDD
jgi:uncharacterized membrane protein YkoI